MKVDSTNGQDNDVDILTAIENGLARDGGLYVPQTFPQFDSSAMETDNYAEFATQVLQPFFDTDIRSHCQRAFNFPIQLKRLNESSTMLELFHGPTAAFKDFGARFLAEVFDLMPKRRRTILVATSGDTGGAVAAAFEGHATQVAVLFPKNGVSALQEKQLTCWQGNIHSFRVDGNFDECQSLVKEAFQNDALRQQWGLTSANSINLGRLLPQSVYYAWAALRYQRQTNHAPSFVIPSGNMGNAVGCYWARAMGFPIDAIYLACNANKVVPEYLNAGTWNPRPSIKTEANAMDVGNPSNMARLRKLIPDLDTLRKRTQALSVDDTRIRQTIAATAKEMRYVCCPHTATAIHFRQQLPIENAIIVATAHPAKFEETVKPLVGDVTMPSSLANILTRPNHCTDITAHCDALFGHFKN